MDCDSVLIGDIELAAGLQTYLQSVICEQETEAYVLDIRNYDRLISKRNKVTVKIITANAALKLANRSFRFQQIPLLKTLLVKLTELPEQRGRKKQHEDDT